MFQPIYPVFLQGAGAAFATAGGTLVLFSVLFPYRQPIAAEQVISQ
ncbi:MAG: hypothetical protein ACFFCH_04795 [Promethearchaeota archaeon]